MNPMSEGKKLTYHSINCPVADKSRICLVFFAWLAWNDAFPVTSERSSWLIYFWLCVSMIFDTACFVSQEVALGTPPRFEKLKHVLEITFDFAEEMSGCVLLMANATEVLVLCLRFLFQKHFETNFPLKILFNLGCSASKNKLLYSTKKEAGCQSREN